VASSSSKQLVRRVAIPGALARMPATRHYAIEASAGTGKTYLIEHRFVDLLLRGGANVEQILVVTFTEKATAELATRIRSLLERLLDDGESCPADTPHWTIDDEARARIETALIGFDRAAISTIHGFCHRLVAEHAFAGGRHLRQEQIADSTAFESAFRSELRERFAVDEGDRDYLVAWLEGGRSAELLQKLLYECSREGSPITPVLREHELLAAAGKTRALAVETLESGLEGRLREARVHPGTARATMARVRALVDLLDETSIPRLCVNLEQLDLQKVREQLAKAAVVGDVERAVAELEAHAVPLAAAIAARFLPAVHDRLRRDKHEHGRFDFDDMLSHLWSALEGPTGSDLAARLRNRHRFALIDEFQDTDDLQWKIFRRIYIEGEGGYLSIIGDPKQAIYGFRGADVYTYLQARAELVAAGGELIRLGDNYRSTTELVDAYNRLFGTIDDQPFFSEGIDYVPVRARAEIEATDGTGLPVAPFEVLVVDSDTKLSAHETRDRALSALVAAVERTLAGGWRLRKKDEVAVIGPKDLFVLTRSASEARDAAAALRARGIPCALYQQEGLLTSDECSELIDLLTAIANPRDRSARLRAWQTDYFGVRLSELGRLFEVDDAHPLVARLYDWKELADRRVYEQLFTSILEHSGIIERELMLAASERSLTNILHLFELLLEEVVASRCDIHELVRRLRRWVDDAELVPGNDRNLQRLESDRASVQIMTVHKSKGLEAPVVFLYGGFGAGPPRRIHVYHADGKRRVHIGRASGSIKDRIHAEAAAEDQRLLYVAVTRAAVRVVAPLIAEGCGRDLGGYYAALNRRLQSLHDRGCPGYEFVPAREPPADAARGPETELARAAPAIATPTLDWSPAELGRTRRGFVVTSYTRLKHAGDREGDEREVAFDEHVHLAEDELPGGAESGILIHEVLEHVDTEAVARAADLESWSAQPHVSALFDEALRRHGRELRHRPSAQRMVWSALRSPLRIAGLDLAPIASCRQLRREVEFLYPLPRSGAGYVRGFIDLLFELEGRVFVLDWKTDILADYDAASLSAHVVANYQLQADLYSIALDRLLGRDRGRFGGLLYAFVRGMRADGEGGAGLYFERPDADALEERYRRLAEVQP